MRLARRARHDYLPGFGHDALLPLYDAAQGLLGIPRMHRRLLDLADLRPGDRVLEVGCGTGNLTLLTKRMHPKIEVVGLDPDPLALTRARRKAGPDAPVRFDQGYGQDLPYPDASFDHVLSAFMFHHLGAEAKAQTLREVSRVLRTGGALHLVDFGGRVTAADGPMGRLQLRMAPLRDNIGDEIPTRMRSSGFEDIDEVSPTPGLLGRVTFYRATASGAPDHVEVR